MNKYSQFFGLIKQQDLVKEEVVKEFTKGRTDSLTSLSDGEYNELVRLLFRHNIIPPGDLMRKKMIGLAKKMQWGKTDKLIIAALDEWLLKQKFAKRLMKLSVQELSVMVTIFETKVYKDYLEAL